MTALVWDKVGERTYHAGVDRGVLYPTGTYGVAWNGLVNVTERPSGGGAVAQYIDGYKYRQDDQTEEFACTIEAFTYPDEFESLDGLHFDENGLGWGHQGRSSFCLVYRTGIGNDLEGLEYGYQIHLVYNAMAAPSEKSNPTVSDTVEPANFSWDVSTVPVIISGQLPTAHIVLDSRKIDPNMLGIIEDILYGSTAQEPSMLWPDDLQLLFGDWVMPLVYVPYIWELDDVTNFPLEALDGDGAIDIASMNVWYNDVEPQLVALSPQIWDLTDEPGNEFPEDALLGDLGYDRFSGDVWRNESGSTDRWQPAVFHGTYIPIEGQPFPNVTTPGEAWLIGGHLWVFLGDDWYDSGLPVPIE